MNDRARWFVVVLCMALSMLLFGVDAVRALECGFIYRDNCDQICAGRKVIGCRNCGFWCEECDCGPPVEPEMVCCHMEGGTCDYSTAPGAFKWLTVEECDRFWGGMGEKTCPKEKCGH